MEPRPTAARRVLATGALTLLLAGCSSEDETYYPLGYESEDMSTLTTVLVFVGIPLLIMAVVAGLAWLPETRKHRGYRPREGWHANPVWFSGPVGDPVAAVQNAEPGDVVRGGAGGSW